MYGLHSHVLALRAVSSEGVELMRLASYSSFRQVHFAIVLDRDKKQSCAHSVQGSHHIAC